MQKQCYCLLHTWQEEAHSMAAFSLYCVSTRCQTGTVHFWLFHVCTVWCTHARVHMPMCTYGEGPHWLLPLLFPTLSFKITWSSSIGQQSLRSLLSLPPDPGITCMYNCTGFLTWVLGILTANISPTEPSPPTFSWIFLSYSKHRTGLKLKHKMCWI